MNTNKVETISIGDVQLSVSTHGGEMVSLTKNGIQYLWNADPKFWGRRAPVLFPFVGQVRDKKYRFHGTEYSMGQHGFARDREFQLLRKDDSRLEYALFSTPETRRIYPFDFILRIIYELKKKPDQNDIVKVTWIVENKTDGNLYFSIGGHPAFMCPLNGQGDWSEYRIRLEKNGSHLQSIQIRPITTGGNVGERTEEITLDNLGQLVPTDKLFSRDALILENHQADTISLIGPDGKAYLTVKADTPVLGIWSPVGKHAPFICIEPWYGRTDADNYTGFLEEREFGNILPIGGTFAGGFDIEI